MTTLDTISEKIRRGVRIDAGEAALLWERAPLGLLSTLAVEIKRAKSGDTVFYNRNIHIEPTNVCVFDCLFCSFHHDASSPLAWDMSLDQIEAAAAAHADTGITEVHIVGGVHPRHDLEMYAEMIRRVKRALPRVAVKAFSAVELAHATGKASLTFTEGLTVLKEAGLEAIPGGGAEIFSAGVRKKICPDKADADTWLALHEAAHGLGIGTNATMLYGHVESVADRIDHMERLRALQDRTGGFDAFIPLKYRSRANRLSHLGETAITDDMRTMAMARIFLDNFPHIKAYWPMFGKNTTELALAFGADDIDGTISDTTRIYSMAGAEDDRPSMSIGEIEAMAARAGMAAVERDTFYKVVNG